MKKKYLAGLVSVLVVAALSAPPAFAKPFPLLWTDSSEKTLLRSVTSVPKNQPDALEFANNGPVLFNVGHGTKEELNISCNEVEIGTTVVVNSGAAETKLAMPFGVAEGDNCITQNPLGTFLVPTYFDTTAAGAVPATITITGGPPFIITIHKLKLSQNIKGTFCTLTVEGVKGEITNPTEGLVEESPPNLNLVFGGEIPITCGPTRLKGGIFAKFFLETMSTVTDTAWIGP